MRAFAALLLVFFGFAPAFSQQSCSTGLCLQQVNCPNNGTTTITGVVYAPNGTDPLPNVLVYIPNAAITPFAPGVSCPVVGAPPDGSPITGATTAFDGTFTIGNVPVGTNIPLVIQAGRWRRQVVVPSTAACTSTSFSTRFPQNQTEGEIPKFAIATGAADQVECVLRKVGIADTEFTDASGSGRINLFSTLSGVQGAGAVADAATPSQASLMASAAMLNSYDVLMLPCEGGNYTKPATELANLISFANAGGRVYSSHFSYSWMYQNPPFNTIANWIGSSTTLADGVATIDPTFAEGNTLSMWLQYIGASTTPGQIAISTVKHDFNGVNAGNQSWLTLNNAAAGNPVMQFVFDTPVAATGAQCGKVLFNEYHVENPVTSPTGKIFPVECGTGAMTPQEKLLEYSLFELSNDGTAAMLTPATQDFGTQAIGFGVTRSFVWTNNSTFPATINLLTGSGDFSIGSNNCSVVAGGASCTINVVFDPTAVGARTGTLTVGSAATTLTSSLTGTGIPDLVISTGELDYGSLDVGASASQSFNVTNTAPGAVPVPALATTGDYSVTNNCGTTLAAAASCTVKVTFTPTATGARAGTLTTVSGNPSYPATPTILTGNGIDFTIADAPNSGTVVAGDGTSMTATVTPLAGFAAPLSLTCTTNANAATCTAAQTSLVPAAAVSTNVSLTTTAKYAVIGYGGVGGRGSMWWLVLVSGGLLWSRRKVTRGLVRLGIVAFCVAAACISMTGCSGKLPAQNASYTAPGTYSFTVTATDGFLVHSATYSLTVTAK